MRILGIVFVIVGMGIIGYSFTLDAYSNKGEFEEKYMALEGKDRTEKFYELKKTYQTLKYTYENYGITILILGVYILIFLFNGWNSFSVPETKSEIILIGLLAILFTIIGFIGDLSIEMFRVSSPHWADSIGIPLASVPMILLTLVIWFLLNLTGLIGPFKGGGFVKNINLNSINYWYLIVLLITIVLIVLSVIDGDFWFTSAGIIWAYFYLSILVGRREGAMIKEKSTIQ